jgi:predicted transposase YbfD/YdcC
VDSVSYYISSEEASAYCFGKWIQGHRRIENNLHWIKDVILKEDSCQISKKQTTLVSANVEGLLGLMSPFSPSNKVFA